MKEFERFTDTTAMRSIFQERLPSLAQGDLQIAACRVLRTRYKTYTDERTRHRSFLAVHYELEIADPERGAIGAQQFYARAYLNGRSQLKFHQLDAPSLYRPRFGEALVHWPDLGLIVWAFPNDPQLPHLPAAVDVERVKSHLPYAHLPGGFNRPEEIAAVVVEVIRYKPEVRCTIRYQLQRDTTGTRESLFLYGKTYATDKGCALYGLIETLWRQSRGRPGHFVIARPLGYDEALHMVWQEALSGVALSSVLSTANYEQFLPMAAAGLACLHQGQTGGQALPRITNRMLLAEIGESAAELMAALPEFAGRLGRLLARLEDEEPRLTPYPETLIHRDFHVKQLLVYADDACSLALFDFDDLATGDPLQDIAFFLTDCHFRDFEASLVAQMAAVFVQTYQSHTGRAVTAGRLNWHMRLQLLAKAHWYYKKKQLSPRLRAHVRRIIDLAEQEALIPLEKIG